MLLSWHVGSDPHPGGWDTLKQILSCFISTDLLGFTSYDSSICLLLPGYTGQLVCPQIPLNHYPHQSLPLVTKLFSQIDVWLTPSLLLVMCCNIIFSEALFWLPNSNCNTSLTPGPWIILFLCSTYYHLIYYIL